MRFRIVALPPLKWKQDIVVAQRRVWVQILAMSLVRCVTLDKLTTLHFGVLTSKMENVTPLDDIVVNSK